MVDQVLAGHTEYRYYHAVERYYSSTQNGPHVVVYLSNSVPVLTGTNAVGVGAGVRVECYTSMTTNLGAQRFVIYNQAAANITWGVQELVVSSCGATTIGGVLYDLPASYMRQNVQADISSASASLAISFLLVFVLIALFWRAFRR